MPIKHSPQGGPLSRNPLYQYMQDTGIRATTIAKKVGYRSLSAFYKALRFERTPDPEKLVRIGKILGQAPSDLWEIWTKERAR